MRKGSFIIDLLVLTVAVFVISWLFRRHDPGWFQIQASAWMIVPLLVGGRHGFSAGVTASLAAATVATLAQHFLAGANLRILPFDHPAYYLALLLTGVLSGWTHYIQEGKKDLREEQLNELKEERDHLSAMNRLYRENEIQLESTLASHRIASRSLTREVEAILASEAGAELAMMDLFHDQCGLRSAVLYRATGNRFEAMCLTGEDRSGFPPHFGNDAPAVARTALESGEMVTCRSLWEEGASASQPQEFLAAMAHKNPQARYLLLIRDMRFEFIDWENLARMEAVFHSVLAQAGAGEKATKSSAPEPKKAVVASR